MTDMNILVLNAGSSSLKYKILQLTGTGETVLDAGNADHSGGDSIASAAEAVIQKSLVHGIDAIGHRVVHGGPQFLSPVIVTSDVMTTLHTLQPLDPLHNPSETAMIEAGMRLMPKVPSVAVFDTSFHQTMPDYASTYAIPADLTNHFSLRRYGFHGISYQYVSHVLLRCLERDAAGTKMIICHLGSGASVCALRDGRSVDTSMGLTPLEGLVMGTRCGDLDPGLLLYLLRERKMTTDDLDTLLNKNSGLLGISAISADVRVLDQARAGKPHAALALAVFAYRVRKYIGAYAAALGGVDAIAFTGGIGEHSSSIRKESLQGLEFIGMSLDENANDCVAGTGPQKISSVGSPCQVWVIPTNEELQIAREVNTLLS